VRHFSSTSHRLFQLHFLLLALFRLLWEECSFAPPEDATWNLNVKPFDLSLTLIDANLPVSPFPRHIGSSSGVYCRNSLRTRTKLFIALFVVAGTGVTVLSCYACYVKVQAESLLKDVTALTVGSSTESDVEQLVRKHGRYLVSRESHEGITTCTFRVQNKWLSELKLEPPALFDVSLSVKGRLAYHIGARLMRSMDIYPTFQASAGIVDEYSEYPDFMSPFLRSERFGFPTPIGKPYLRVQLDAHASPLQRQHAFGFSFRCLVKPGAGCDLPCDYLPSAWQDWKAYVKDISSLDVFNQHHPNNSRCR